MRPATERKRAAHRQQTGNFVRTDRERAFRMLDRQVVPAAGAGGPGQHGVRNGVIEIKFDRPARRGFSALYLTRNVSHVAECDFPQIDGSASR